MGEYARANARRTDSVCVGVYIYACNNGARLLHSPKKYVSGVNDLDASACLINIVLISLPRVDVPLARPVPRALVNRSPRESRVCVTPSWPVIRLGVISDIFILRLFAGAEACCELARCDAISLATILCIPRTSNGN